MTPGRKGRAVAHPGLEDAEHRKALLPPTTRTGGHGGKARQPKRGLATFYTNPKTSPPPVFGGGTQTLKDQSAKAHHNQRSCGDRGRYHPHHRTQTIRREPADLQDRSPHPRRRGSSARPFPDHQTSLKGKDHDHRHLHATPRETRLECGAHHLPTRIPRRNRSTTQKTRHHTTTRSHRAGSVRRRPVGNPYESWLANEVDRRWEQKQSENESESEES